MIVNWHPFLGNGLNIYIIHIYFVNPFIKFEYLKGSWFIELLFTEKEKFTIISSNLNVENIYFFMVVGFIATYEPTK